MIQNMMPEREGAAFVKCTCTMLPVMMLGGNMSSSSREEEERLSDSMDRTLSVTVESFTGGRREA